MLGWMDCSNSVTILFLCSIIVAVMKRLFGGLGTNFTCCCRSCREVSRRVNVLGSTVYGSSFLVCG